jgi:hypothetical protein
MAILAMVDELKGTIDADIWGGTGTWKICRWLMNKGR